jgi:hypothetical protein
MGLIGLAVFEGHHAHDTGAFISARNEQPTPQYAYVVTPWSGQPFWSITDLRQRGGRGGSLHAGSKIRI